MEGQTKEQLLWPVLSLSTTLKMLHMGGEKRALTEDGLSVIAYSLADHPVFVKLPIPCNFDSTTADQVAIHSYNLGSSTTADRLSQEVNEARKSNGLPPIEIEGEYCVLCGCVIPSL